MTTPSATHHPEGRLSLSEKIGYSLSGVASNFFFTFFGAFLMLYYTDGLGLAATDVGTLMLFTGVFAAGFSPVMGILADRTRSRFGTFRPYLLYGAIPYGICGVLMFTCPEGAYWMKLAYAYATYTLMLIIYTVINVPSSALLGVLSPDPQERMKASSFSFFGATAAGMIIGAGVLPLKNLFGQGNDRIGYLWTMAIFAVLSIGLFLACFAMTREKVEPAKNEEISLKRDFRLLFTSGPWVILFAISTINLIAAAARGGCSMYYLKYVHGDELMAAKMSVIGLFGLAGTAIAPMLTKRLGKKNTMIWTTALGAVFTLAFYFFPADNPYYLWVFSILWTLAFAPCGAVIWSMYADSADYIEWKHGRRITGLVYAGVLFGVKVGWAIGGALAGWIMGYYGFVANQVQTPQAIHGILVGFCFVPAAFNVVAIILLYFYRLTPETLTQIEADLAARREA